MNKHKRYPPADRQAGHAEIADGGGGGAGWVSGVEGRVWGPVCGSFSAYQAGGDWAVSGACYGLGASGVF